MRNTQYGAQDTQCVGIEAMNALTEQHDIGSFLIVTGDYEGRVTRLCWWAKDVNGDEEPK